MKREEQIRQDCARTDEEVDYWAEIPKLPENNK